MRFIMVGGFLGAGKTTTIGRLASQFQQQGLNVGIVTNDQAADLVDTHTLRSQGFDVGEVAGACFCCNFNELTDTVGQLSEEHLPDIILAEPVGSCTDLVATVVQPLRHLHGDQYQVAPYGVILKPSHGFRILKKQQGGGFSPQAAYIFEKQLEEADFIILNRIDELSASEVSELEQLLHERHPDIPVVKTSAKTGEGFDDLLAAFQQEGEFGTRILELDYDIYAEGEAELGWLNSTLSISAAETFSLDETVMQLIEALRKSLGELGAETAHLKVIGIADGGHAVANLISSDSEPQLSLPSHAAIKAADLIINARVAIDPEILQTHVDQAVSGLVQSLAGQVHNQQTASFRPGRPVPTHRYQ